MNNERVFLKYLCQRGKHGFILISSLFILLLLSILAVSMGRSFGLEELIAGNQREKNRAFESAQAAMDYAEGWLNTGTNATAPTVAYNSGNPLPGCTSAVTTATSTPTPAICSSAAANAIATADPTYLTAPWTVGVSYLPPNMTISTTGGSGTYYKMPMFYIQYLGTGINVGYCNMYQITAIGYGGDASSIAVVQSIYQFAC